MIYMLNELDLTHFDTSEVTIMTFMFDGCFNLKFINLSNIDTSSSKYGSNV